jgi:hypothetical protein
MQLREVMTESLRSPPWWVVALLVASAFIAAIASVPVLPMHDGPQHVYGVWFAAYEDVLPGQLTAVLASNPDRVTALGMDFTFLFFEYALGWRAGLTATLCTLGLTWIGGWLLLLRRVGVSNRTAAFVLAALLPTALPWMLYMGYLNFLIGASVTGIVLWTTHITLFAETRRDAAAAVLNVFIPVAFACAAHAVAGGIIGVFVFAAVLAQCIADGRWRRVLLFAFPALPVVLTVLASYTYSVSVPDAVGDTDGALRWQLATSTIAMGQFSILWWLLGLGGALAGIVAPREPWVRGIALVALAALGLYLAAPFDIPGWQAFAPRWGVFGVGVGIVSGALSHVRWGAPRIGTFAVHAMLGLSLVLTARAGLDHRTLYDRCVAPYLGLEGIERGDSVLGMAFGACEDDLTGRYPLARFASNAELWTAMEHEALAHAYTGYPFIHALRLVAEQRPAKLSDYAALSYGALAERGTLDGPLSEQPPEWLVLNGYLARNAALRDATIVTERPEAAMEIATRGFALLPQGASAVLRFEGCAAQVVGAVPDRVRVHATFYPDELAVPMPAVPLGTPPGVVRTPCGPTVLQIWADTNGDHVLDATEGRCVDGAGASRLQLEIPRRPGVTIACTWVEPTGS